MLCISHPVRRVWKGVEHHTFPLAFRPPKQNYIVLMGLSWITVATTWTQTHLTMFMQCNTRAKNIGEGTIKRKAITQQCITISKTTLAHFCLSQINDKVWWMRDFHTHGKVEAEVSIRRGVEVGGAHIPPALLFKNQGWAWLNISTLGPIDSSLYVPAG